MFLVLDGPPAVGKSTVARLLVAEQTPEETAHEVLRLADPAG